LVSVCVSVVGVCFMFHNFYFIADLLLFLLCIVRRLFF